MNNKNVINISELKSFFNVPFVIAVFLSLFGIVIVSSATRTLPDGGIRIVLVQAIGMLLGLTLAFLISKINFDSMKHFGVYFYMGSFLLLILVLVIGTGDEDLGSKSWVKLGFIGFQPSEIVKLTFIIICAIFLERIKKKQDIFMNYFKLLLYGGSLILLIILQKDFGTAAVFIFIFLLMLFISGVNRKIIIAGLTAVFMIVPIFWFFVLNDTRKDRLKVFINPELDPLGAGFNVIQSKTAIGSGRLFGQGLFDGYLNSKGRVPVKESDFIFSVIGEELGFIGAVFIVILFAVLLYSILRIARKSVDTFQSLVCYGIFALFTFHIIQNISMNIGLLPVTGVPLPFISAGGTALVSYFLAIGVVSAILQDKRM